ncbi:MAG: hypothetical protein PHO96_02950 [Candidatus Izemoplasmatales bacterium]|jgi:threonine/homoserine/homoserine lactone efflux protein|nr:hypothetical protein [Candidatus Izemoplasmatales bacterium]
MSKAKFHYGWVIKWILAAILIAAGILMKVYDQQVVYAATGIAIVLFSVLRVVPLLKTLKKEFVRTLNLIEIIFDTIMGGVMIYVVFSGKASDTFWVGIYGYLLAVFFYVRGIVYLVCLYYFDEKTEPIKFWFHVVCLTLGTAIFVLTILGRDIISTLGWIVLFISVGGGLYLAYDGYGGYRKYRESSKALNETKKQKKQPKEEKGLPQPVVDEKEEKETYVN